jgi:hypothetical protein
MCWNGVCRPHFAAAEAVPSNSLEPPTNWGPGKSSNSLEPHFEQAATPSPAGEVSTQQCVWNGCNDTDKPCCGKTSYCYGVDGSGMCSRRRAVEARAAEAEAEATARCIGNPCSIDAGQGTAEACCGATLCIVDALGTSPLGGWCQPRR